MGKTMAKANVIWGEQHSVSLASFSDSHMVDLANVIKTKIGPRETIQQGTAWKVINAAKINPKMKDAYVKVGVIGSDLVLRCKEKRFFGDIELDAVLVPNYRNRVAAWKIAEAEAAMADVERLAEEHQEAERKAQARRLKTLMTTPDAEGDTPRDKILRAAQKAKKLGVGDFAKDKLARQGLTPMQEEYHSEVLDHQKNRYGRNLGPLRTIWEQQASQSSSFSQWLDDVEAKKRVPGLQEAQAQLFVNSERKLEKVVRPEGTAGGLVIYLDDETRKPYVAAVNKGMISGPNVKNGTLIFVIGPDNKIYAGSKARAARGQLSAFNHSSFFSGGPVKAAGTMEVAGGTIVEISNESGHYSPTESMILQAVRKFATGDRGWLGQVQVKIKGTKSRNGLVFLGIEDDAPKPAPAPRRPNSPAPRAPAPALDPSAPLDSELAKTLRGSAAWHGKIGSGKAEELLLNQRPGAWLLRESSGGGIAFSWYDEKENKPKHSLVTTNENFQEYKAYIRRRIKQMVKK